MDGQADVSRIRQGGVAGVHADSNSDRKVIGPGSSSNLALDGERGVEPATRLLEDGEHLIGPSFDFAATVLADRRPQQAPNIG